MQTLRAPKKLRLSDYEIKQTLGTGTRVSCHICVNFLGSFGRVKLARNKQNGKFYAIKILKKAEIIRLKQVDHVLSENSILASISHPFLVNLIPDLGKK